MTDNTLLTYALQTDPDPLQVGSTGGLTLVVSNMGRQPVTCTRIVLTIPVGTAAKDLVADPTGLQDPVPDGWKVDQSGGMLTYHCDGGATIGTKGLSFTISNLRINDEPGTATLTIDETAARAGGQPQTGSASRDLSKFPGDFQLTGLTADPLQVPQGGSVNLMWTGSAAVQAGPVGYTISYQAADGSGTSSYPVGPTGPYTAQDLTRAAGVIFTLTAKVPRPSPDEPAIVQRQIAVAVDAMSIDVAVEPPRIGQNGLVRLRWNAPNADHCILDDGSVLPATGYAYFVMTASRVFTVNAVAADGSSLPGQASVTVDSSIVPTPGEAGYMIIGAQGSAGLSGQNSYSLGDRPTPGGDGGPGSDALLQQALPPLDTLSDNRVIPIRLTGGKGGTGGPGGFRNFRGIFYTQGGRGGQGGNAVLDVTLNQPNQVPAQYIVILTPGPGGDGGPAQGSGKGVGPAGPPGPAGSISATVDGLPVKFL